LRNSCRIASDFVFSGDIDASLVRRGRYGGLRLRGFLACIGPAGANVVIAIDKAAQRMAVTVDGKEQYLWKVSTGLGGGPKAGTYQPQRLEKSWFSRKYDMSPMPHAIFFHEGYAIHGTAYVSRLGTLASHGCVRLHPTNAATLFSLVRAPGHGRDDHRRDSLRLARPGQAGAKAGNQVGDQAGSPSPNSSRSRSPAPKRRSRPIFPPLIRRS